MWCHVGRRNSLQSQTSFTGGTVVALEDYFLQTGCHVGAAKLVAITNKLYWRHHHFIYIYNILTYIIHGVYIYIIYTIMLCLHIYIYYIHRDSIYIYVYIYISISMYIYILYIGSLKYEVYIYIHL